MEKTGKEQEAEELKNASFFDFSLCSDTVEMSEAVIELSSELRQTKAASKTHRRNLERSIRSILSNLLYNHGQNPETYTAFGRTDKFYPKAIRYNPFQIKLRGIVAVADGLIQLGYVDYKVGFINPDYGYTRLSRLRAKTKLIEMLERRAGLTPSHIQIYVSAESIILRDENKRDIDYRETNETRRMREHLSRYNEQLKNAEIKIRPVYQLPDDKNFYFDKQRYHRVFNHGSFEYGGRFYGPWWQTAPKEVRKQILINGKPTVELDYSAQHIHILYDLAGADYFDYHDKDDDPYTVEGFGSENRGLMKQIFLRLTGTKNRAGLNIAMGQWVAREPEYVGYDYKRAINAFISKHHL